MYVHMFEKESTHQLGVMDYFVVQMEHRMAFVRALIMTCHELWPTDYVKQMWLSWILLAATTLNVGLLMRKTLGAPFRAWWGLLALASVAIFSPIQYRIVLWPMMFQVACPAFFLSTAMLALLSRLPLALRFMIGLVCAVCASQTFATGMLVWVLVGPLILWSGAIPNRKSRWIYLVLWGVAFVVNTGLYFHNLKNGVDSEFSYKAGDEETMHRDMKGFSDSPMRAVPYVLRFLGSHLGRGTSFSMMDESLGIGIVFFVLFALATVYWLRHARRADLQPSLLVWLMFGAYSIGAGLLVALGRLGATHNGENVLASRYVIHAVPITIALTVLAWLIARDMERPAAMKRFLSIGGIVLLGLQTLSYAHGCRLMEMWESTRLRGATNTLFYKTIYQVDDAVPANRKLAKTADDLGLLKPAMLKNQRLDNFNISDLPLTKTSASWLNLVVERANEPGSNPAAVHPELNKERETNGYLSGFAYLPNRKRVADGVFFTWKDPKDQHWEIFQVGQVESLPLYLRNSLGRDLQFVHVPGGDIDGEAFGAFHASFQLSHLPPGTFELAAWAFDYKRWEVYRIVGSFELDTVHGTVKTLVSAAKKRKADKKDTATAPSDDATEAK